MQGFPHVSDHGLHDGFHAAGGRQVAAQVVEAVGLHLALPHRFGPLAGLGDQGADDHADGEERHKGDRYSVSATAKVSRGGTKKKSKASTPRKAVRMAGFRPRRRAAITTASR